MDEKNSVTELRAEYLRRQKNQRLLIYALRIAILILIVTLWELLTTRGVLNPFSFSSPSRILATLGKLSVSGQLRLHVTTSII